MQLSFEKDNNVFAKIPFDKAGGQVESKTGSISLLASTTPRQYYDGNILVIIIGNG